MILPSAETLDGKLNHVDSLGGKSFFADSYLSKKQEIEDRLGRSQIWQIVMAGSISWWTSFLYPVLSSITSSGNSLFSETINANRHHNTWILPVLYNLSCSVKTSK